MSDQTNVTYLSLEDAARILTAVGGKPITEEMLRADIEAGAPAEVSGRINLAHYAAWLAKELGRGD